MTEKVEKKVIMIVEDDPFVSDIYFTKITASGYEAVSVASGTEALEKIEKGFCPNLILLDILMPQMNGLEALKKIKSKAEFEKVPIILLTNLSQKEEIDAGFSSGAAEYLIKSHFTPSEVMEKINKYIK